MKISEHANYLLNEYGRLQFDYAAYCKPYGEALRNEARNNLEEYIAELEAAQRWIPVSERLPEFGAPILFYDSILERINKGTCTAMNSDNTNLHWFTDDDLFYFGDRSEYVTHWMPLPKFPEVQE
jgi:hypothetical protein